jgi:hypothetical protein
MIVLWSDQFRGVIYHPEASKSDFRVRRRFGGFTMNIHFEARVTIESNIVSHRFCTDLVG